jgi:predicted transcriptional regulator
VPIKQSVSPDHIVCLEDGKKLRMLKRYLSASYRMTPEEYRARWSLPRDYPMVVSTALEFSPEVAE